jgi:hypothetical protein
MNDFEKLAKELERVYKAKFPHGYFRASHGALGGFSTMFIKVGLVGEDRDCAHGIRDNDIGHGLFSLTGCDKDGNFSGVPFVMETMFHSLTVKPKNPYHALGFESFKFRKTTKKTSEELVKAWEKYINKCFDIVQENKDNIYNVEKYDMKYISPMKIDQVLA